MANKIDMFDNPPDISMKMPISSPFSYAKVGLSNMPDDFGGFSLALLALCL